MPVYVYFSFSVTDILLPLLSYITEPAEAAHPIRERQRERERERKRERDREREREREKEKQCCNYLFLN